MKKKIVVSFSGGKDSVLALHRLQKSGEWEIDSLLTTLTEDYDRTTMHGVRNHMLEEQAKALGIPLRKVWIPRDCVNEVYQQRMEEAVDGIIDDEISYIMFGDIFLEDVKTYREKMLEGTGLTPVFPIWGEDSKELIHEFVDSGFKTVVCCVDTHQIDSSYIGRVIDEQFILDYPKEYDVCGENGEFHTFVFNGPNFSFPIAYQLGAFRLAKDMYTGKDRFYYVDLLSNNGGESKP
ncbi:diphthine--ammonia ligase [Fictibacillus phosphorivorans]|uniref:Dph6-related ATP pyrophosphatase n=1 Tax=Fictibacillus phosphorivorans TaxID=1221500 RepID=UPI00203BA170|nr:diphthine--ammonia ligase [Fictibacillus phosphorivorans]MCM3717518.1 diphthine--ammonia ligase [Fictibacillus phosphorivorans]MCM3775213.1 diphthine--ammonia ligase [Fictibacillus phosphorivorans]